MRSLFLLLVYLITGIAFLLVAPSEEGPQPMFLFSDELITPQTFWYFMYEHLGYVVVALIFCMEIPRYKIAYLTFLWVQVGDAIDFWATYNTEWWWVGDTPVTYNIIRIFIFGSSIIVAIVNARKSI